jgi:hypothetical protein
MKIFCILTVFLTAAMAAPAPNNVEARSSEAIDGYIEARDLTCPGSSLCLGGQCKSFQCIGGGPTACGYYNIGQTC